MSDDYTLDFDEVEHVRVLHIARSPKPPTAAEMRTVEALAKAPIRNVQTDLALAQQMTVFVFLRRRGNEIPWEDAADVVLEIDEVGGVPDPTGGEPSGTSPPSATTGG